MKYWIILLFMTFPFYLKAQSPDWSSFEHLIGKTWHAEESWENGGSFKQTVHFSYDLSKQIVLAKSMGYLDQEQKEFGDRNHGIRKYDATKEGFVFYEFDVFGGLTTGEMMMKGKDIIYLYEYQSLSLKDTWTYVDDVTYTFTVSENKDGGQVYLETTFRDISDQSKVYRLSQELVGEWKAKAWDGSLVESWVYKDDKLVQTSSYEENGKVLYAATSFIEEKGGELILTSVIRDSNPKIFKATSVLKDRVVFENSDYTNPSKLSTRDQWC